MSTQLDLFAIPAVVRPTQPAFVIVKPGWITLYVKTTAGPALLELTDAQWDELCTAVAEGRTQERGA
jgi:hypothetical protein